MGIFLKPVVNEIKINNVDKTSELLPILESFSVTKFLTNRANLLDVSLILPSSLSVTTNPDIYQKIQIKFSYDSINFVDTGLCTIDRNEIKIYNNIQFLGAQGYDYYKGLINSQGTQTNDDEITAFLNLTENITIGGQVGSNQGEYTLLQMLNIIATNINADLVVNGYVGFGVAGWSDSRSIQNGVDGNSYGEILEKLANAYGYLVEIKPPTTVGKSLTIIFSRYSYLVSNGAIKSISKNDLISQSTISYDYSKVVRYFIIKYPYWDYSGIFSSLTSYKMILYGIDTRVSTVNTSTADMRNEGFLFGYKFPLNTVAPTPLPNYVTDNAVQRLYGSVWENNQKILNADLNLIGDSDIDPGSVITLTDFNDLINGNWLITDVKHDFKPTGWVTNVKCFKIRNFTVGFNPSFDIYIEQMLYSTFDSLYG